MRKLILFIILITNTLLLTSQIGYPKEIILNKDTLVAFKYNQVREINKGLEEGEGCKVLLSETEKLVLQQDGLIVKGKELIANLEAQINGYDLIVKAQDEKFKLKEQQYQKSIKANKTNKTIFGITVSTLIGTGVGLLIWGLTK